MQTENFVTRVTVRHHLASLVMPSSNPRDEIFNQYLSAIKDSYMLAEDPEAMVLLPVLKPTCSSVIIYSACDQSLFKMIFNMTLLEWSIGLMVLYI